MRHTWGALLAVAVGIAFVAMGAWGALMMFDRFGPAAFSFSRALSSGSGLAALTAMGVLLVAGGLVSLFGRRPNGREPRIASIADR